MLTKCKYVGNVQFMRTDKQIFIDWLKHQMGVKRVMKGQELAKKTHMHPGTISGYLTGKSKGPRDIMDRRVICEALGADYDQVIKDGRREDAEPTEDLESRLARIEASLPSLSVQAQASTASTNTILSIHHQIIEQFQQRELALEINQGMLELERINPDELKEVAKYVRYRKVEAQKTPPEKKRASGDEK